MKVKEKDFKEMGCEEQVTGYRVIVYLKDIVTTPFGGSYHLSVVTIVGSKKRANKVAQEIADDGNFTPEGDEDIVIIPDAYNIYYVTTKAIKRKVYIKK